MSTCNKVMLATLLSYGLLASGHASASAYAVSVNSVTNFGITFSNPTSFYQFTFTGDTAAINMTSTGSGGVSDAAAACINCSYNNSFAAHGTGSGSSYAYGDTLIANDNVQGSAGSASAIGEVYLTTPTVGIGYGQGMNTLTANFNVASTTKMTFDFWSDPYLQSVLSSGSNWASADMSMTVTVTKGLLTVFSWTPDGAAGGIFGGVEGADPFSLNLGLPQTTNGMSLYDPANSHYSATTNNLLAGTYTLNISMVNSAQVETVPLPAAAWLLGSGLLGLVGLARKKSRMA